jgi:RNA polymerase sigma-70 factor (ECF subfamily)
MKYQKVIEGFQRSPGDGLEELFQGYGQQLFGFSVTHFHIDEDEGYDVLYKTMETVGKVITRYEFSSENHFANWLFKIHKNNILQLLRSKKSKEKQFQMIEYANWENEVNELSDGEINLDDYKSVIEQISSIAPYENSPKSNKLMNAMEKALHQLNDIERGLLLLRMNNYSYDEIAQMLNIENNQLKVKFNRAKAKLEKRTLEILKNSDNETR